jgi:hypothetical protein
MRVTVVLIPTPVPVHVWDLVVPTLCSPTPRITIKQGGTKTVSMNNLISSFVYFPVEMGGGPVMSVGFTSTYVIDTYHHLIYE